MSFLFPFRRKQNKISPAERIAAFLRLPEHSWIAGDPALLRRVALFFALLPEEDLEKLFEEKRLLLLYCNQRMSAALYQFEAREIVLVFPELRRLLASVQYHQGYAVLAHEFAHILLAHSRRAVSPLAAQFEADAYAARLGLGPDLAAVLRMESDSDEVSSRLRALTEL